MSALAPGRSIVSILVSCLLAAPLALAKPPPEAELLRRAVSPDELSRRVKRYVPVPLGPGADGVPATLRPMLPHLVEAADQIDRVFWRQYAPETLSTATRLARSKNPHAQQLASYLRIHYGPWDWHKDDAPFLGVARRPAGVALYPGDLSKRELDQFIVKNPTAFGTLYDPYTVIRRDKGRLVGQRFSRAYKPELKAAAAALRKAADAYKCPTGACPCDGLVRFLRARAASLLDDSYQKSELVWMDTGECPLDVAIGPYEFYVDRLLGLKASFEAIIYLADRDAGRRFRKLAKHHDALIENLPLSPALLSRFTLLKPPRVTIADVLYTAGEARAGYQIRAFVLPNDEAVRRAKGTKNVILRNVVRAKFDKLLAPLVPRIFEAEAQGLVSFNAYLDFLLSWNLAHAVAPNRVELPGGATSTARQQLRGRYTFMNALRGESIGLLNYLYLQTKGVLGRGGADQLAATYLASLLDSIRLAGSSPQTLAKVIVYNYLAQEWVFRYNGRKRKLQINPEALEKAVRKLASETLEILARGDYGGAGRLIVQYGIVPPELRAMLSEVRDLPVDILPNYTVKKTRP